jgi:hypothetical protein
MKRFKVIAPLLIVAIWSQTLVSYSRPVVKNFTPAITELRSESQLRSEASLYDAAIREISKATTIRLDTADDIKAANALLAKQIPNLKFNRSKLVVSGLSDATFAAAVKERTPDSKSTESFAAELAKAPNAILKLNGASALQSRLSRSVESDVTLLRSVSARLKKAAADLKAKIKPNHSIPVLYSSFNVNVERISVSAAGIDDATIAVIIYIAIIFNPGIYLILAGPITGGLVIVGAALLVGRLIENFGTEKGRDRVAECEDAAKQAYDKCAADAAQLCCGLSVIGTADCASQWLLDAGVCLLS